jgi:hypothetical protein
LLFSWTDNISATKQCLSFNRINQPDAANSQVYYSSFKYSSTRFGHPHAHHQKLQQLQHQPLIYRQSLVIAVLLVVVGLAIINLRICCILLVDSVESMMMHRQCLSSERMIFCIKIVSVYLTYMHHTTTNLVDCQIIILCTSNSN